MPGVQMPHCVPPSLKKCSCKGARWRFPPTPSIVMIWSPALNCPKSIRHEFTTSPLRMMEHAPHSPSPHPSFVPVRRRFSRRTSSNRTVAAAFTLRRLPLMMRAKVLAISFNRIGEALASPSVGQPSRLSQTYEQARRLFYRIMATEVAPTRIYLSNVQKSLLRVGCFTILINSIKRCGILAQRLGL